MMGLRITILKAHAPTTQICIKRIKGEAFAPDDKIITQRFYYTATRGMLPMKNCSTSCVLEARGW